ncbi:MAG TPA: guanylate kinase [Synergistaceae bacterium]|nr:guanylate kinase [Synergistaceae bacterium]
MDRGRLFVISGPSGVGKGTLRKALFETVEGLEYSISCTTRESREGETEGIDYNFISHERFRELVEQGSFLEWAEVHGNLYGTLKENVERILADGRDAVLEIDVQGALQVKGSMPEAVLVFILPPSEEELRNRLDRRGTEKEEDLEGRLKEARNEMLLSARYDHLVVNDDLDRALEALRKIIESYRDPGQTP